MPLWANSTDQDFRHIGHLYGGSRHADQAPVGREKLRAKSGSDAHWAFDGVVADLDLRTPAEKERAAKIVIVLAACQTAVDPAKLRDDAASVMRDELIGAKRT